MKDFLNDYKDNLKMKVIVMIPFLISTILFVVGLFMPYYQVTYDEAVINYGLRSNVLGVSIGYFIGVLLVIFANFAIVISFELKNKKDKYYYVFPIIMSVISLAGLLLIFFFSKPTIYPDTLGTIKSEDNGIGTILLMISLGLSLLVLIAESFLFYKVENGWTGYKTVLKLETNIATNDVYEEDFYDLEEVKAENERLGIIDEEKKCPTCGAKITEGDNYCPVCGNKLD